MGWGQAIAALAIAKVPNIRHNRAVFIVGTAGIKANRLVDHCAYNVGAGIAER
ncbi:hypothetical protein SDC9_105766 [bioreactor metagenome]|uniref:Uncharacterized protein n=1 Tax=bioreactor metagenome TaxID=1076179 RepID=A0A645B2Z4_9ZZZZ